MPTNRQRLILPTGFQDPVDEHGRLSIRDRERAQARDWLLRPHLRLKEYKPKGERRSCTWCKDGSVEHVDPLCGAFAHFVIYDPVTEEGAPICHEHAQAALRKRAETAATENDSVLAQRMERALKLWTPDRPLRQG